MPFRSQILFPLLFVLVGTTPGRSQDKTANSAQDTSVKKIGENLYRIGEIEFDARTREVSLPVAINMREGGPIEYLLVHENGKVHESIFVTSASPLHLQIAMKLLRFKTGHGDVFNRLLAPENVGKEGGTAEERGDSIRFLFKQNDEDPVPIYEFVIDGQSADPMTAGDWIYTGSAMQEGTFMAEAEGSIIAIYLDHLAMFNMTREGADDDDRWGTRTSLIPEIGTKGNLIIQASEDTPTIPPSNSPHQ